MFTIDGLSTNPILGYDFNQEFSDDLYRVITSRIATFCSEHQLRRTQVQGLWNSKSYVEASQFPNILWFTPRI